MLETATLEFEVLTACPICGHDVIPILNTIRDLEITSHYCNCQRCGQLFLNPRMTDEQTTAYYAGMYRDGLTDNIPNFMERDTRLQINRTNAQLPLLKPLVKDIHTALDIGTSLGYLLDGLHELGVVSCEGVEPDIRYHDYFPAHRYKIYRDVEDISSDNRYDLITMSHSLEHMNHPREFLDEVLLAHAHANTTVMIDVPNTEVNRGAYRIHHPMAFTPFTLTGLFEMIGWQQIAMGFYGLEAEGPFPRYMVGFYRRRSEI